MDDAERLRLLGKYRTPRFRIGRVVFCEARGEMTISGITDAPIPWPVGKGQRGRTSLIVYKDLAKAIRRESNQAIAHWWGVDPQTVSKWRKVMSVKRATEGTSRLHSEYDKEPWADSMREKSRAKANAPERRREISEARRGKPRPAHVKQKVRRARLGSRHSDETKRKMSAIHRERGTMVPGTVPWTPEEDELIRTLPSDEVVRRTGRSLIAVYSRRNRLRVPDGRGREGGRIQADK